MELNKIYYTDCLEGIKQLDDNSVSLVITSPPYAMQRKFQYGGINEKDYPEWTLKWMEELRPKLKDDASVCINIRPHIKNGEISDYVLRTRLALRENGWKECEELIWIKTTSPPMGSTERPRRAWNQFYGFLRQINQSVIQRLVVLNQIELGFLVVNLKKAGQVIFMQVKNHQLKRALRDV